MTTPREIAALVATAVVSFTLAFVASTPTGQLAGAAAEPDTRRFDLPDADAVVTGAIDSDGVAWVLARHRDRSELSLYRVTPDGSLRRSALPLQNAGALGAIAIGADGTLWAGSGARVARIDARSGRATRVIELGPPTAAVAAAQRAPDGTVLGWGQVTAIAVDQTGTAWVARYAVPALTRLDALTVQTVILPLTEDTDIDRLSTVSSRVWFTTNFGVGGQLGARIGELDTVTGSVRWLSVTAAALVPTADGIEAIGAVRSRIDPVTYTISSVRLPREPLSLGALGTDGRGNLIARVAKANRLLVFDELGRTLRTIDFDAGSFAARGRTVTMVAPLAFVSAAPGGAIWFAARGGNSVYRTR